MRGLLLVFIIVPVVEMWFLIQVGKAIGAWPTIGLVLLTAMIGLSLLQRQGIQTLLRVQERLNQGEIPATEVIEGVLLAVGGALLLTPGFFTDFLGFSCLLPFSRKRLARYLLSTGIGNINMSASGPVVRSSYRYESKTYRDNDVLEGEYRRED